MSKEKVKILKIYILVLKKNLILALLLTNKNFNTLAFKFNFPLFNRNTFIICIDNV